MHTKNEKIAVKTLEKLVLNSPEAQNSIWKYEETGMDPDKARYEYQKKFFINYAKHNIQSGRPNYQTVTQETCKQIGYIVDQYYKTR